MELPTRNPRPTRRVSLTRLRILIRCQGWVLARPNPNPGQLILTRMDRLTRATRFRRRDRAHRLPRHTRLTILTSITSSTRKPILTRLAVMARRTRLTRMVSLTRWRRLISGAGQGKADPNPNHRQIRLATSARLTITTWIPRLNISDRQTGKSSMTMLTRLPIDTRLDSLEGITGVNRLAVRINFRPWLLGCIDFDG